LAAQGRSILLTSHDPLVVESSVVQRVVTLRDGKNAYGFPALITQIAVFFAASMWLAVNHADVQAPDYPLIRIKYVLLLALAPLSGLAAGAIQPFASVLSLRRIVPRLCGRFAAVAAAGFTLVAAVATFIILPRT
jgi:hypothetical protein